MNPFVPGDRVVLALGTYQGTTGVFLSFNHDPGWANIRESNGRIRSHPIVWLAHDTTN